MVYPVIDSKNKYIKGRKNGERRKAFGIQLLFG